MAPVQHQQPSRNPVFAFSTVAVTLTATLAYVALFTSLLYTHLVVPQAPLASVPEKGLNLTEAWLDLQYLSNGFHPYNSHRNDLIRHWLLQRIRRIVEANDIEPSNEIVPAAAAAAVNTLNVSTPAKITVFDDLISNTTFSTAGTQVSVYFEGTNVIVYLRGKDDDLEDWWRHGTPRSRNPPRGVLVNAHYDSVATGFGATDDGVGVVSILQLIKYFSTSGNQPHKGIVALFNNGEEDYLNGAQAFMRHPISRFPATFLNLEGAGAGGRATLFRSTDTEVTRAYKQSKYPFGTVISGDGFNSGFIRSQTDYVVFNGQLGLRGLDVAFMEPRAKYHTSQDSTRHTSRDSVWHMLSASLATMKTLTSNNFDTTHKSDAVWFDLYGSAFAVFSLHTLFAISVTLLVVSPIFFIAVLFLLKKADKSYLFSTKKKTNDQDPSTADDEEWVHFSGWRGVFRFPIAFILASAAVIALAYLLAKVNPYIIYSSPYAVWSMMLSAWFFVAWFILRGADSIRPTALQRAYVFLWLFAGGWIFLVAATVAESRYKIAGVYVVVIPFVSIFLGLLISLFELFALPKKADYIQSIGRGADADLTADEDLSASRESTRRTGRSPIPASASRSRSRDVDNSEPTETTSLLSSNRGLTFSGYRRRIGGNDGNSDDDVVEELEFRPPIGDEQLWSGSLPSWTWMLQFLLFVPITVILLGQIALLLTSALYQTPADGSPVLFIYICIAVFSIFLFVPLSPFMQRISYHIPVFVLFVLTGTLIYNLLAFPFSDQNRLKVFFVQKIDLDTGINRVSLTGVDEYVQDIVAMIPSSAGQSINCTKPELANRDGLRTCSWNGLSPHVTSYKPETSSFKSHKEQPFDSWLTLNITRISKNTTSATIRLSGLNTRACRLYFSQPLSNFTIDGAGPSDERVTRLPAGGVEQLRLWHREWEKPWTVQVQWNTTTTNSKHSELTGRAVCLWSDQNQLGTIPALDEVRHFMPSWSIVLKLDDGLVEGSKAFSI